MGITLFIGAVSRNGRCCNFVSSKTLKDINGSGYYTNYSTNSMREEGGLHKIYEAIEKLSQKHMSIWLYMERKMMNVCLDSMKHKNMMYIRLIQPFLWIGEQVCE